MSSSRAENDKQPKRRRVEASSVESRIGISFFLLEAYMQANHPDVPFARLPTMHLKSRISDFVVRELSAQFGDGEPLHLTEVITSAPKDASSNKNAAPKLTTEESELVERIREMFTPLLTDCPTDVDAIVELVTAAAAATATAKDKNSAAPTVTLKPITDKVRRTGVHQAVKDCFGGTHLSKTEKDGCITIFRATAVEKRASQKRSSPLSKKNFTHFTLYKENIDSTSAFRALARCFHISTRQIMYSGTKDKRAVTTQRVAIRGLPLERLVNANVCNFGPNCKVKVCAFSESEKGLSLGDLLGNHFEIVLRPGGSSTTATPQSAQLHVAVEEAISKVGVVNYFGPQRFGTTTILTSDVGIAILNEKFEDAINLIVASKANICPPLVPALPLLRSRDYDAALNLIPHFCPGERDLVSFLQRNPNDFRGALSVLPRNLAMLYLHAVQSLVWNKMASERLSKGGLAPIVGDMVLEEVAAKKQGRAASTATAEEGTSSRGNEHLPAVYHVQKSDVNDGIFALSDVLLPLPGTDADLVFPTAKGCTRSDYEDVLRAIGASALLNAADSSAPESSSAGAAALSKLFHFHGTYRNLTVQVQRWKMRECALPTPDATILPTDLERLEKNENGNECGEGAASSSTSTKALVVEFSLPPGSYATCVLRELCDLQGGEGDESGAEDGSADEEPNSSSN